jgi:NDP-sugar pyrophosphorylase family protein
MAPATENYPQALLTLGNKTLLCHQLEYCEENGLHDILIVCEKKYASKIERYVVDSYRRSDPDITEVELVVLAQDEESANVLRLLQDKITKDFIII